MKIIAHRGGMARAPENSLLAFDQAIRDGADGIECDLVLTKDNQAVVCHVPFYSNSIAKLTWAQVKQLRQGGEQILHYQELLEFIKTSTVKWLIEPKRVSKKLMEIIADGIGKHNLAEQITLVVFYTRKKMLGYARRENLHVKTCLDLNTPLGLFTNVLERYDASGLLPGWDRIGMLKFLDKFVSIKNRLAASQPDATFYIGPINHPDDLRWAVDAGFDAVLTDNVPLIKAELQTYAKG